MGKNLLVTGDMENAITRVGDLITAFGNGNVSNSTAPMVLHGVRQALEDGFDEIRELRRRVSELEAARRAYASEFEPGPDGEPDVGSIHQNIRKLKSRLDHFEEMERL